MCVYNLFLSQISIDLIYIQFCLIIESKLCLLGINNLYLYSNSSSRFGENKKKKKVLLNKFIEINMN